VVGVDSIIIMIIVLTLSNGIRQLFEMAFGTATRLARRRPAEPLPAREAGHA